MTCVYRHIRLDKNEPFYIGIGSIKRAYVKKGRNVIWNNIANKTEYRVDILFEDLTREEAIEKEIEFIKLYGRIDLGTGILSNRTDGGEGLKNYKHTDDTKKIMSKSWTQERKENNPQKGKSCPQRGNSEKQREIGHTLKRKSGSGIVKRKNCPKTPYRIEIKINGEIIILGYSKTYDDALKIRLEGEKKYWN